MKITKSMKTIFSISAICAALALPSVSSASIPGYDMAFDSPQFHQKKKNMMKRMAKMLELSEQQQAQIKTIKEQAKDQNEILRDSMKKFRESEKALIQAEEFDEQAFLALQLVNQQIFSDMALNRAKTKHALFNVLTTEQQEKWQNKMKKRKERFEKN